MTIHYYLALSDIRGDSTLELAPGALEVTEFSFAVSEAGSVLTGGGAGSGVPAFTGLDLRLADDTAVTDLLRKAATGGYISNVSLIGIESGEHAREVYRVNLSDVVIQDLKQNAGGVGLSLAFDTVKVETRSQLPNGSLAPVQSFGYDLSTHTSGSAQNAVPGGTTGGREAGWDQMPAAAISASARSVRSHVNSGSSRPKWPYAAVLA